MTVPQNSYPVYGSDEWREMIARRLSKNIRLRQLVEPAERWIASQREAQRKRQTA